MDRVEAEVRPEAKGEIVRNRRPVDQQLVLGPVVSEQRRVAILNRELLNVGVTVFIAVRTNQHNPDWPSRFRDALIDFPEIVDFYRMSGDIDYLLRAFVPDIESYDALYKRLIARIDLSDITSMFAMEEIKSTMAIPLDYS